MHLQATTSERPTVARDVTSPPNGSPPNERRCRGFSLGRVLWPLALACAGAAMPLPSLAQSAVESLTARAADLHRQGKFADALPVAEQGVAAAREPGQSTANLVKALTWLGLLQREMGQFDKSEASYREALGGLEKSLGPEHPDTATILHNLADLHDLRGQFPQAEPLYRRALAIKEKTVGPDHPTTATTLANLGAVLHKQGNYAAADPLLERSLSIREKTAGPAHMDTANSLNNLAENRRRQARYAEAEQLFARVLAIAEKSAGLEHPLTSVILLNIGSCRLQQGRFDDAEPLYTRALAIREKALGDRHAGTAQAANNLAYLYDAQGRDDKAEQLYRRAVAIFTEALGEAHPETKVCLDNLARILAAEGRWDEAVRTADRARMSARAHVTRVLPALTPGEQLAYVKVADRDSLDGSLLIGMSQPSSPRAVEASAAWLINGKAVGQEASSQRMIMARATGDPNVAQSVVALAQVRQGLAMASQFTPAPGQAVAYKATLAELERRERDLVHAIGGQLAALDRDDPWVSLDAVRAGIPAGAAFIDIALVRPFDFQARGLARTWLPARYAAWIIPRAGRGEVTVIDLGDAAEIDARVEAHRSAIAGYTDAVTAGKGQAAAEKEALNVAQRLAALVLEPVLAALGSGVEGLSELLISPDGGLWLVPWQALPLSDGRYAIERFTIGTLSSGRDLAARPTIAESRGGTLQPGPPLVFADPDFEAASPEMAARLSQLLPSYKPTDTSRLMLAVADIGPRKRSLPEAAPLPGTRVEAVAAVEPLTRLAATRAELYLGRDAQETILKAKAVRPRALVLATHGFFSAEGSVAAATAPPASDDAAPAPSESPQLRCGLLLAGANTTADDRPEGSDDGVLTGAEIVGLDLMGTDLVVLSACDTGLGVVHAGEGVAGLRQAFQIAGARSVVATLWQVPDSESAQIMAGFYANLTKGQTASNALREAQLAFIKQRREDRNYESAHPYLWAAYGVTGR